MAARPVIEYYFSFISLWSYIGSSRFHELAKEQNAIITYKPIDLMHIFSVSGGLPVRDRPLQRQAYRLVEMERWSGANIPLVKHPKFYPADPSLAHRVFLAAIKELGHDHPAVQEFAHQGLKAVWANELNIADPDTIVEVANSSGLDGRRLLIQARSDSALATQEKELTELAKANQVFGAPFYFYRGEPFWGQDRLDMLKETIESGRDPIEVPETIEP